MKEELQTGLDQRQWPNLSLCPPRFSQFRRRRHKHNYLTETAVLWCLSGMFSSFSTFFFGLVEQLISAFCLTCLAWLILLSLPPHFVFCSDFSIPTGAAGTSSS